MDITIDQQVALDKALVPHASRLRIDKIHHHSIRFKMNNKKCIVNLEYFREMLQICPINPNQQFDELPFEEAILTFLRELGHSGEIKMITNVEHKDDKKNNEMYYPRFTKVIGTFFMSKDQSIPKRNKKLTPFYKAFLVIADVPAIYMQEFWATATFHYHSIRFKMNNKKHTVNLEELGHSGEIKMITDVNINKLHQPCRSFDAVINKYHSGKSTGYDSLRLSQAQILWGMYHKKTLDFAYLLGEDFVYQVKHKDAKKSNEIYYPRFTNVIVNFFMTKDQSIPRRNKVNWHFSMDDYMFTTIKLVFRHQNTQQYGAILPVGLTNEANRNFESYKDYYSIASGAEPPKTKASVRRTQSSSDTTMPPPTAKGKRLKTSAKVDKPVKEKQPTKSSKAKGLSVLSGVALTEIKLATKRILTQTHISHTSGSGVDEGTGIIQGVPDVPTYESDDEEISYKLNEGTGIILGVPNVPTYKSNDEEISWKSNDDDDQDDDDDDQNDNDDQDNQDEDDDEQTDLDNDGDDFVHPKFSTHDEEDKDEECFDPIVQTPSQVENTYDKDNNEDSHGMNVEGDKGANEEDDSNELYGDVNINLEAVDLSELELKKILIDKMESNKSIHRSDEQKNLYKALVDGYECNKLILDTYGDTVTLKRRRGVTDDQLVEEASHHLHWFQKQAKPPTPNRAWNKTLPATHAPFMMNRLKVDTLTPELLAGLTYELMKGSWKSLVEHEFFLEEVYKAKTNQLDWNNHEGQKYPYGLLKPLPLIPNSRGLRVILFDHIINNDLKYLRGGAQAESIQLQLQRPRQQIMDTLNGLKTWYLVQCEVKYRLSMTNMLSGESRIGGANVNSFIDL
nr:hypothetical protein [Tanacetum cinerariifolium]